MQTGPHNGPDSPSLAKCRTGIRGLDEITEGGLPRGRPTLVCGAAGSGKTLLAMEFIVRGARELDEPGVFMAFEETEGELTANVHSLGFDLDGLVARNQVALDYVYIERSEIEETGDYGLDGLFIRLGGMIEQVGARRVALDGIEALFAALPSEGILRAELRRLFRWLKDQGVTAVITGEQGENTLTRHGLEEYVSDCVIFLDHRVNNQVATRRLRIVKYRGSRHGTNEYPALIDEFGLSVLPISSVSLDHRASRERVSTGIPRLDAMLSGQGYFKGSSVLISGTAGAGKSSLAAAFADSVCQRGGRCLYWSSEESSDQILRNMSSIGIDLGRHIQSGLLQCFAVRPTLYGLENHLVRLHKLVGEQRPEAVILDPITNFAAVGDAAEVKIMLTRVIDFLKKEGITAVFTSLTQGGGHGQLEQTDEGISTLTDTWLLVQMVQSGGERNRLLYVLKSRGMAHSNQVRELLLSDRGIDLADVYTGTGLLQTGSERLAQQSRDQSAALAERQASERRRRLLEKERRVLAARIQALQAQLAGVEEDAASAESEETQRLAATVQTEADMKLARYAD
ncbi:circadian clock protein KaiC [Thiocystis violascens]|uniref:non-specific serine/threonine protein kinase n=1 Tax=Thiocystis violascens (strain ATCC 17096 / DSM 198 / 6111) TaxID=765911 RepID=I3Y5T7_THIV6|nr:circadian clock protein KaiC [Thiocystis violascens]AFL72355.1 RecA-superfamily ATPase possibly involved in signal transduction [Thiocystis violascens DSM 198]